MIKTKFYTVLLFFIFVISSFSANQSIKNIQTDQLKASIIPVEKQAEIRNKILLWRLKHIIPQVMRRNGIDMWILINQENNEDPLYLTMVPQPNMTARRRFLLFYDQGKKMDIERLDGTTKGTGDFYQGMEWNRSKGRLENLVATIKKRNPKKIGINISDNWAQADGLSATNLEKLKKALGPDLAKKLVSAEKLCVGWLETRSPEEIKIYPHICSTAHQIIREFFSNQVITPGSTTTEEVRWWVRQRVNNLGLQTWFQPDIFLTRHRKDPPNITHKSSFSDYYIDPDNPQGTVIQRGDLLHCDFGIIYMGLCTDMQWEAYVLKKNQTKAPPGIIKALKKARIMAEIYMKEFKGGKTGGEIAFNALQKAKKEDISAYIYSHPIGYHGHGAGVNLFGRDSWEKLSPARSIRAKYPLHQNTAYAIEFQIITDIPEWGGQKIRWGFEEDAVFTQSNCRFIDSHQKELLLIR